MRDLDLLREVAERLGCLGDVDYVGARELNADAQTLCHLVPEVGPGPVWAADEIREWVGWHVARLQADGDRLEALREEYAR